MEFSDLKIHWVVITALFGKVTAVDSKKLSKLAFSLNKGGCKQLMFHFSSKEAAKNFIKAAPKLSKKYKYIICTDKQFGQGINKDDVVEIKFTQKQLDEAVIK